METRQPRTVSRFKEVLPQVLAMSAANMVVITLTVALFFSTLVIAELHVKDGQEIPQGQLYMDDTQASWFGSLPFFCQPIGALASGVIVQWLGRKRALLLINIPYCLGILLLSVAPSVTWLFVANVLLGTTVGFTEAPINSYFGEICQPELRSILAGSAGIFFNVGMCILFVIGSLLHWRTTAATLAVVPIVTMVLLAQVPESPIWLIAKGRIKEAEAALCWLRGWVDPSAVQRELKQFINYHENFTMKKSPEKDTLLQDEETPAVSNEKTETKRSASQLWQMAVGKVLDAEAEKALRQELEGAIQHKAEKPPEEPVNQTDAEAQETQTAKGMVKLLLEPETRRPLVLCVLFFVVTGMGGMWSIRPFIIEIMRTYRVPVEAKWSSVIMTAAGVVGSVLFIVIINRAGKRKIALSMTAVCGACCILLGLYAFLFVEPATRYEDDSYLVATWVPIVLFATLAFANTMQGQVPWLYVAEAFPYRTRGVAGGMAAASNYIIAFVAARTYLNLEHSLQLFGTFWFYGAVSCIGFVYLYFEMPETEGKTLEEIEILFASKKTPSRYSNKHRQMKK